MKVEGNKLGVWDQHICSTIYKIEDQQAPTVSHRELYMGKESEKGGGEVHV